MLQKIAGRMYLVMIVCLLSTVSACGQKGDLYLPENQVVASPSS